MSETAAEDRRRSLDPQVHPAVCVMEEVSLMLDAGYGCQAHNCSPEPVYWVSVRSELPRGTRPGKGASAQALLPHRFEGQRYSTLHPALSSPIQRIWTSTLWR